MSSLSRKMFYTSEELRNKFTQYPPSIDQLIQLLPQVEYSLEITLIQIREFSNKEFKGKRFANMFQTLEELVVAFVMYELYNKIWDCDESDWFILIEDTIIESDK